VNIETKLAQKLAQQLRASFSPCKSSNSARGAAAGPRCQSLLLATQSRDQINEAITLAPPLRAGVLMSSAVPNPYDLTRYCAGSEALPPCVAIAWAVFGVALEERARVMWSGAGS